MAFNLSTTRGCGVFFPFIFLESSECFWVKTGAMVHFLGPLGGLVWFSGTSAVLRIKIEKSHLFGCDPSPPVSRIFLDVRVVGGGKNQKLNSKKSKKNRGTTHFNLPESVKKKFFQF